MLHAEASAASVTFEFSGVVTEVFDPEYFPGDAGWIDASVGVGTPLTGSYTFDSAATDLDPNASIGRFHFPAPATMEIRVGNYTFRSGGVSSDRLAIIVEDGAAFDGYTAGAIEMEGFGPFPGGATSVGPFLVGRWLLRGPTTQLSSAELPLAPPPLSGWTGNRVEVFLEGQDRIFTIAGAVTSIVPEPGTGGLTGAALALLAVLKRASDRSRKRAAQN
jgi:hypothetical protein